jgi:hypothetical protein
MIPLDNKTSAPNLRSALDSAKTWGWNTGCHRRGASETDPSRFPMNEECIFNGGARLGTGFGALNASAPLARLTATRGELRLSCPGHDLVFPRNSISTLSKHRGIFSSGVRIEHTLSDCDQFVVFWTFRFRQVQKDLSDLGYEFRG